MKIQTALNFAVSLYASYLDKVHRVRRAVLKIKLRIVDGLVWMVGLTVQIKLRFQFSPA